MYGVLKMHIWLWTRRAANRCIAHYTIRRSEINTYIYVNDSCVCYFKDKINSGKFLCQLLASFIVWFIHSIINSTKPLGTANIFLLQVKWHLISKFNIQTLFLQLERCPGKIFKLRNCVEYEQKVSSQRK